MKHTFVHMIILCGLLPFTAIPQTEDPRLLGNAPITFYGMVVDENGQPIPGVHVQAEILVGYLALPAEGRERLDQISLTTDASGRFIVDNVKGTSIRFNEIEKDGYKLSAKVGKPTYLYFPVKVHPDPEKPQIFRMWKKRGGEQLIQPRPWNGNVACDGTTNRFDLLAGKRNANGSLEIICTRTPLEPKHPGRHPFDYRFQIAVLGGSIQSTDDEFTYLAPERGYKQDLTIAQKADDPNWHGRLNQEFYFKTAEGRYGRLTVDWYASQQNPTHLDWNCSINPSGSRNLER